MKRKVYVFRAAAIVLAAVFFYMNGCAKKEVKVSVLPEPEPVLDTAVTEVIPPVEPEPAVDSAALLESRLQQAQQNIYFNFNKYNLRTDALDQLTAVGRVLLEHPNVSIMIEGHCDERGSSEYNMGLGENRAKAAKQWLVSYGIADSRIQTTSYGKERPAVEGCFDEPCHQRNRRCEFNRVFSMY
jgi:peptidoglycan-associated lipoprotein